MMKYMDMVYGIEIMTEAVVILATPTDLNHRT